MLREASGSNWSQKQEFLAVMGMAVTVAMAMRAVRKG